MSAVLPSVLDERFDQSIKTIERARGMHVAREPIQCFFPARTDLPQRYLPNHLAFKHDVIRYLILLQVRPWPLNSRPSSLTNGSSPRRGSMTLRLRMKASPGPHGR